MFGDVLELYLMTAFNVSVGKKSIHKKLPDKNLTTVTILIR